MADARAPDPRIERSRARLTDALGTLLVTRDAKDISVSALCAQAHVSRPTFYQHFASVDEVAVAGIERRLEELRRELADGPDAPYRLLVAFLDDLDTRRSAWQHMIGSGATFPASRDAVETWLADRLAPWAPGASPAALRYAAAGFLGAVRTWLREGSGPERPTVVAMAAELLVLSTRVLGSADPVPRRRPAS